MRLVATDPGTLQLGPLESVTSEVVLVGTRTSHQVHSASETSVGTDSVAAQIDHLHSISSVLAFEVEEVVKSQHGHMVETSGLQMKILAVQ
jgi:hypothetical protein